MSTLVEHYVYKMQEFLKVVNLQFAMIDVNKAFNLAKKKDGEEALDIHNEIRIITAS